MKKYVKDTIIFFLLLVFICFVLFVIETNKVHSAESMTKEQLAEKMQQIGDEYMKYNSIYLSK